LRGLIAASALTALLAKETISLIHSLKRKTKMEEKQ